MVNHTAAGHARSRLPPAELARARAVAAAVPDPEIPVVTLEDLGILREVRAEGTKVVVVLTPTYCGCPATDVIRDDVRDALVAAGFEHPDVAITLSPAWTTDWISAEGRRKLRAYGIVPPSPAGAAGGLAVVRFVPRCPRCDSPRTSEISEYGSTPCKALHRCLACLEPFDYFKPL
ncbi:MAG: phenylacetate-CoA oxygenase subunit PaaJ [Burkholderiaceae bacterium]|nr:phenylacetate-CoA oxygenase subunit PaaJ [Burkholderiaceae bacterium]